MTTRNTTKSAYTLGTDIKIKPISRSTAAELAATSFGKVKHYDRSDYKRLNLGRFFKSAE